jgi:chromate reductase
MNAIEAYIHFTPDLVDDAGNVSVPSTETFLRDYMAEFQQFIARVYMALPREG